MSIKNQSILVFLAFQSEHWLWKYCTKRGSPPVKTGVVAQKPQNVEMFERIFAAQAHATGAVQCVDPLCNKSRSDTGGTAQCGCIITQFYYINFLIFPSYSGFKVRRSRNSVTNRLILTNLPQNGEIEGNNLRGGDVITSITFHTVI